MFSAFRNTTIGAAAGFAAQLEATVIFTMEHVGSDVRSSSARWARAAWRVSADEDVRMLSLQRAAVIRPAIVACS